MGPSTTEVASLVPHFYGTSRAIALGLPKIYLSDYQDLV